jgi:uracil-DNA glycosylase
MRREELSQKLFKNINLVEPYPNLVSGIDKMIDLTAFFPGGKGLWKEEESEVFPSILVLGQDFSTEKEYVIMLQNKVNDLGGSTWRNLRKLFMEADVELLDCFFSNVFMGLRKTDSMTGKFPGFKDQEYVSRNIGFLLFQIDTIKPKLIITLGKYSAELVSKLSDDLNSWRNNKALREPDIGLKKDVEINGNILTCVALEHPSMRMSNVKRRRYKDFVGNEAEVRMLKDALNWML